MPPPDTLTTVYATDEHVAIRGSGDYAILCPAWQTLARGSDAVLLADSWVLTSATVDLSSVLLGNVVSLSRGVPSNVFKGEGELFGVDAATPGSLTLRRIGADAFVGAPPSHVDMTNVAFNVGTMAPQIEEAAYALNRKFGIDANIPGRTPVDMYDVRDLRAATVLLVLRNRYVAENRTGQGDFPLKIQALNQALDEVLDRLEVRWGQSGGEVVTSSIWTMRLTR